VDADDLYFESEVREGLLEEQGHFTEAELVLALDGCGVVEQLERWQFVGQE
jgi:hypothetical protein